MFHFLSPDWMLLHGDIDHCSDFKFVNIDLHISNACSRMLTQVGYEIGYEVVFLSANVYSNIFIIVSLHKMRNSIQLVKTSSALMFTIHKYIV